MKKFLISLFLAIASIAHAGYTYNLANASQDAFEDAYYRGTVNGVYVKDVADGDIIVIPAGTATWFGGSRGNNGRIWITKAVTIRGQGDATVITIDETHAGSYQNTLFNMLNSVVVKDMKFIGATTGVPSLFGVNSGYGDPSSFRISNITYEGHSEAYFAYIGDGVQGGLIDHCRLGVTGNGAGWAELIFLRGRTDAWTLPRPKGTSGNVFIEDNVFTGGGYVCDANSNASAVIRFNTIANSKVDGHGKNSNTPPRSVRHMEVYNNTWTANGSGSPTAELRGGSVYVFNNTANAGIFFLTSYEAAQPYTNVVSISNVTNADPLVITTSTPHGLGTGWYVNTWLNGNVVKIGTGSTFVAKNVWDGLNANDGSRDPYWTYDSTAVGWNDPITVIDATHYSVARPANSAGWQFVLDSVNYGGWSSVSRWSDLTDYPIDGQIGVGPDPKVAGAEPGYIWGNTKTGGSNWTNSGMYGSMPDAPIRTWRVRTGQAADATYTMHDIIKANRDYFADAGVDNATGMQVGTKSQMLAYTPSIAGYGWWVTNEGNWNTLVAANQSGQLYVWNGSAWTLDYTPYQYPHPLQFSTDAAPVTFIPAQGTYEYDQTVTLSAQPSGTSIRYTTDGSNPTSTTGTLWTGTPIYVGLGTTTIKAIAYKLGLNDSMVVSQDYNVTHAVKTVTASLPSADYHGTQTVALSCATSGAVIHYTTDGSTPTAASPTYSGPLSVPSTTTIKAVGVKSGLANSTPMVVTITILLEVGGWNQTNAPFDTQWAGSRTGITYFTAPVSGFLSRISAYSTNSSATLDIEWGLYEDVSGTQAFSPPMPKVAGTPTTFSNIGTWATPQWKHFDVHFPVVAGHSYWVMMALSEDNSLVFSGVYGGGGAGIKMRWMNGAYTFGSAWADTMGFHNNSDAWTMNVKGLITEATGVETPAFSPPAGIYFVRVPVSMSSSVGATIRFTNDGSTTPTASIGTIYSGPLMLTGNMTLKAMGYDGFQPDSTVRTGAYTIIPTAVTATTANVGTIQ